MKFFGITTMFTMVLCSSIAFAGALGGPKFTNSVILPNQSNIFNVKFNANEAAIVQISGDHSTDLDFYIYDSNDHLIVKDDDGTDSCRLVWTPAWTGYFTIKIINRGDQENRYSVLTN
jgi:hypothetical protein